MEFLSPLLQIPPPLLQDISQISNPFSFSFSDTSHLLMERIMSQSVSDVSPRTSGRLSHSGPLIGSSISDSPPISPSEMDDLKLVSDHASCSNQIKSSFVVGTSAGGRKTVGRWLKDRKEKKEEVRAQNAQLHAAISVAGVAAAIAAVAAATAASFGLGL